MAAISKTIFSDAFFNENFCILIKISLKFILKGPIDIKPALLQIMAWHRIGDKPLSKPMLTQFTDAYKEGDELDGLCNEITKIWSSF